MEKHTWNKVHCNLKTSAHPSPRWGHSCCTINDEIIYFGGYADSTYMNDLWTFNTLSMDWREIQTTGEVPSVRSNCTMCYDEKNNRIVLYGGGAPNKKRFNSIHLLDWETKQWSEILPKENQSSPWERTYHTAEMFYPYLIIFGGEAMTDLDDVWAYNFQTLSWTQIQIEADSPKPCARRFHSSVKIGNQFYIIAGCHGKYRCLNDIYSMDVSGLLNNGCTTLRWQEKKIKGNTFLTRWGHSSTVFDSKIYIFGGRFSNDLNDILVVDLQKSSMKALKTNMELPKARRRHSASFVGSNMVIFGGFNGEYFNDLHYINVYTSKKKALPKQDNNLSNGNFQNLLNKPSFSDALLLSADNQEIPIHKAILRKHFSCEQKMEEFLKQLENNYYREEILSILQFLYKGYGQEAFDSQYLFLAENYQITLSETQNTKQLDFFKRLFEENKHFLDSIVPKKNSFLSNAVVRLDEEQYINFLEAMRQLIYTDANIIFNKQYCLPVSKSLLSMNSPYFKALFGRRDKNDNQVHLHWKCSKTCIIIFEVLVNYLILGKVVASKEFDLEHWIELAYLSDYYCLENLKEICQQELINHVGESCEQLMTVSIVLKMKNLGASCADYQIKMMVAKQDKYQIEYNERDNLNQKREAILKQVYGLLRFDILQAKIDAETQAEYNLKKKENQFEEKENFQNNFI